MKSLNFHTFLLVSLFSAAAVFAQDTRTASASSGSRSSASSESRSAGNRGPIFRANKDQINAAQALLKTKGMYAGDATGKLDDATREALKSFQKEKGLNPTGTLNRATLEKMGIALTDKQKEIPIPESSYAKPDTDGDKPARTIFRATKEQIIEAQRKLKTDGMYTGDETGKLDDTTREGLKKYQEANGLKATGTLNQATLEKMGVALTDKQKGGSDGPK
jgi:peptidoglycan hydrolase-like protein with peptidoglycan-binding domain